MKKNSLQPKTHIGQKRKIFFGLILTLGLVLLLFSGISDSVSLRVSSPFFKAGTAIKNLFRNSWGNFKEKADLTKTLFELKSENEELKNKNIFLENQLQELAEIKNLAREEKKSSKLAVLLSQRPQAPYDVLIVGLGEKDGISPGVKVLAQGSILLGEVQEVSDRNSRVKLLSFPELLTEGYMPASSLNVLLEGRGSSNFRFKVPRAIEIKVGDLIFSNSSPAYLIGQVEKIKEDPNEPLKEMLVGIPLNLRELRFVEILP